MPSPIARPIVIGTSLLEVTTTPRGVIVRCPGCGAQEVFPLDEEPLLEHGSTECPVFQTLMRAFQLFAETREVRG